ncbi:unnamed protein product [Musa banksii]
MIKLVGLLLYLIKPATAGCEAMSCGRVTNISHPFWLRDPRQPPCGGLSSFELSCEDGLPILVSSYNSSYYRHDIFYGNKSFWVRNKNFNDEGCAIPNYDIRVDLPGFFRVSAVNTELRFFYNCWAPPPIYTTRIDCAMVTTRRHRRHHRTDATRQGHRFCCETEEEKGVAQKTSSVSSRIDFWWSGEQPMLTGNAQLATDGAVMTMHRRHSCVSSRTDGTVPGIAVSSIRSP